MKNTTLWIGIIMLLGLLFFTFVGPQLSFVDRDLERETHRFTGIPGKMLQLPPYPPSEKNPLGSDRKGVDNLSKLILGAKESILIVLAVAGLRYAIAIPLGLLAYKKKGFAHTMIGWLQQLFSVVPTLIAAVFLLSLPSFFQSPNRFFWSMFLIAFIEVGRVAYLVQQQTNKISHEPFVEAGNSLGLSTGRMARKYYFPAILPEVVTNFCVDIGKVMLLVGQLGVLNIFLKHGLGFDWDKGLLFLNEGINWFALLSEHRMDIYFERFAFIFFPALAIMYVILTFNVLGEGLRRHYNRRMNTYM